MAASLILVSLALAGQAVMPSLPRLTLDAYPAGAREAIAGAYKAASARPSDAQSVGALGEVLQAWEQWDAAAAAYARAEALAPAASEWPYLHALVLQRLA